jgi:hypothetical protein
VRSGPVAAGASHRRAHGATSTTPVRNDLDPQTDHRGERGAAATTNASDRDRDRRLDVVTRGRYRRISRDVRLRFWLRSLALSA